MPPRNVGCCGGGLTAGAWAPAAATTPTTRKVLNSARMNPLTGWRGQCKANRGSRERLDGRRPSRKPTADSSDDDDTERRDDDQQDSRHAERRDRVLHGEIPKPNHEHILADAEEPVGERFRAG